MENSKVCLITPEGAQAWTTVSTLANYIAAIITAQSAVEPQRLSDLPADTLAEAADKLLTSEGKLLPIDRLRDYVLAGAETGTNGSSYTGGSVPWNAITDIPGSFTPSAHTHGSADMPWLPTVLSDLQNQIDNIEVGTGGTSVPGQDGKSVYLYLAYASDASGTGFALTPQAGSIYFAALATDTEIATPVASNFSGKWVKFKGEQGAPGVDGEDGTPGQDGANGKSAYELAVLGGYSGTLAEWLASHKGEKGDKGDPGEPGQDGAPGARGEKGDPGEDGADVPAAISVTLTAANWSGSTYTITGTVADITAVEAGLPCPTTAANRTAVANAGLWVSAVTASSVTITVDTVPTANVEIALRGVTI